MDVTTVTAYLTQYGAIAVFLIVLLEYLNLPGFPAGIIMPVAGICAAQGGISFGLTLLLSVVAGLLGSWALYLLGRLGGTVFLAWFRKTFPKQSPFLDKTMDRVRGKGYMGVFLAKLIPAVRTIISIPAGVLQMNFGGYTLFSLLGITLWNLTFIGAGYLFGDAIFTLLGA
jgi:membrane protein DedA with SNARE-associated domain